MVVSANCRGPKKRYPACLGGVRVLHCQHSRPRYLNEWSSFLRVNAGFYNLHQVINLKTRHWAGTCFTIHKIFLCLLFFQTKCQNLKILIPCLVFAIKHPIIFNQFLLIGFCYVRNISYRWLKTNNVTNSALTYLIETCD